MTAERLKRRLALLTEKPSWGYMEISEYLGVGRTKAEKIKTIAMENGGSLQFSRTRVRVSSALEAAGLNYEEERNRLIDDIRSIEKR